MNDLGFIAVVVADSWHIANNQHFGDLIYDYRSTSKVFIHRIDAIKNAFDIVAKIYNGIKPVSTKGLQNKFDNELSYFGREFHIYCFSIYNEGD